MFKTDHKKAFSLIELSIVLIIIGLLVAGVTSGKALIKSSRLSSAKSLTLSSQMASIPGMVAWFETSLNESFNPGQNTNGSQIDKWYNIEPSGSLATNNLTTTASNDVTYKEDSINNLPTLNQTVAGKISVASFTGGSLETSTVVIVFKPTQVVSSTSLTLSDGGASTFSIAIQSNLVAINAGSSVTTSTVTNPASFVQDNAYILIVYFNGASSKVFVNNITEVGGSGATLNPGAGYLNGLFIGSDRSGANGIAAEFAEVIVYNRPLKDSEKEDVMRYLSKKYKITVTGI